MRTRLAPTPSGFLHAGNGVNFLVAWKLARRHDGHVLLRIDDLDAERVRPEYIEDIFRSLEWLGIEPDEGPSGPEDLRRHWSQHLRLENAQRYARLLRDEGHLFACTCTRTQLAACTCRNTGPDLDAPGVTWRLRTDPDARIAFACWPEGTRIVPLGAIADPVLVQRGGRPAYQLASLADDVEWNIDLIVRGEDLLPSTACQVHLARTLELGVFANARFVHHALMLDAAGNKLSKSEGAASLKMMRENGSDPWPLHEAAERILHGLDQAVGGGEGGD